MEPDKRTTEYLEKMKQVRLSDSSRTRIAENLESCANFHSVRVTEEGRSIGEVSQTSVWYATFFKRITQYSMPIYALMAILFIGGGTTFAAQGSAPGDVLYPVKIGVTENIRSAFAFSSESEARLQAQLLEERVTEAEKLEAEGRLSGELATRVEAGIKAQAKEADEANDEAEASVSLASSNQIRLALTRFDALVGTNLSSGSRVAVSGRTSDGSNALFATDEDTESAATMSSANARGGAEAEVSTMIALDPIDIDMLWRNTSSRLNALIDLLERYEGEFRADVYAEYRATLDDAAQVMMEAESTSDAEARELLFVASDLVAKVEAAITRLGQVEIDTETGAIIDIDFSSAPDYNDEPMPMPLPMPPEIEILEDSGDSGGGMDSEAAVESTTGLSI